MRCVTRILWACFSMAVLYTRSESGRRTSDPPVPTELEAPTCVSANKTVTEATGLVTSAMKLLGGLDAAVNCAGMAGVPGVQVGEELLGCIYLVFHLSPIQTRCPFVVLLGAGTTSAASAKTAPRALTS